MKRGPTRGQVEVAPSCTHEDFEGKVVCEPASEGAARVTLTVWCRGCLQRVEWIGTNITPGDPTEARLYCHTLTEGS